ncbi:MAG: TolC family protein [Candidatus Caldatribacteriota bacterium]
MHKITLLLILVFSFSIEAKVQLTEEYLKTLAKGGSPRLDEIEAAFQSSLIRLGETKEGYAPELFGKGSYAETNERALIEFSPVFSPVKQVHLGVRQNFSQGVDTSVSVITDQRSASSPFIGTLNNATTTTLAFTMRVDLWRDLFGRMSKAKIENSQLEVKRAQIEKEIQEKTFHISLRRLYWSLVANDLSLKTSQKLLKTAQKQAREASERLKNAVAEADEVARYNAQVSSREGNITYLKYQRELYLTQLKNLLPELSDKDIVIENYDVEKAFSDVLSCTFQISQGQQTPYQYTKYDELVTLLKKIKEYSRIENSRYSDIDVKLFGTVKATGVSLSDATTGETPLNLRGSYGGSFEDMTDRNRTGYEVGIEFNMPLGETKEKTQKSKELYDEKRLISAINSTNARVMNTHREFVKTIKMLNEVITSQRVTTQQLEKRLKGMQKKYEQARVSVNDLIMDQDALLQSELATIDIQLQILNSIFDYLVIFPDTPCAFNRI